MSNSEDKIITRFAPSPTGVLHIGGARTSLFNYLFSKQNNGKFILRIEDTDKERSKKEYETDIISGLEWLGIEWNELYRQNERKDVYKNYIEKLIKEDKAYISEEAEGESREVIRLKNPGRKISFDDLIRGKIEFDTAELGDFVIAKDKESPLYHLAVVIDDFEMKITHIIRGEDHISNTPRQILIQEAIGFSRPKYVHIPLILGQDRSKLSKRHGAASVNEYKNEGYLPGAIVNFLAFLGWNPGIDKEIYDMDELIRDFSLEKIQKGGAIFNIEKLNWINKEYIKKEDPEKLKKLIIGRIPEELLNLPLWKKIIKLEQGRITKLSDIEDSYRKGELNYFFKHPEYEKEKLLWRDEKNLNNTKENLKKVKELLNNLNDKNFLSKEIKKTIWHYAEEKGRGNVLWPFRIALTGMEKSPDPFTISEILGKEETIKRLEMAISIV